MKYKSLFIICFFVLFSFFSKTVNASHSMGADLTYTCLGGNNYKLRLSFYRDCSGIAAPTMVIIDINSISCGYAFNATLMPIPGTGQEITPICSTAVTKCNGGIFTGIREYIYEGTITLPAQCADWGFSYSLCCRNGAISTIINPLGENITIHSMLNNLISPCNNSPTFTNKPVPFVCVGQQFCYNHGAYDVDGDSLVYTMINPLGTNGVPVVYLPGYSATQPINSVPAMTFNSLTGDFCATPQSIEVTVMAVLIQEYRNGILIGEVERDMQITVRPCGNNLPDLTGINGTNSFAATICAGQPFCFDIFSTDPDTNQNITVSWDNAIPAGTFNATAAQLPVATFCWTPAATDVSNTPHCFTVMVKDDACPYYGSQIYSYCLTVVNVTADAGADQTVNCGGIATITATGTTTTGGYTYLWSNGVTTASQIIGPGAYTVTVSNGFCTATDVVQIHLNSGMSPAFNSTNSCINNPVSFTNSSVASVGVISGYSWSFGDGSSSTLQNPGHVYVTAGSYNVCLELTSSLGCMDSICKSIIIQSPPTAGFTVNNDCEGKLLNLTNTSAPANLSSYSWNFGNGTTSTLQSPVLSFPIAGTYNVSLVVIDSIGCADTIQYPVKAFPYPAANFTVTGGGLCQGGLVSVTDNSIGIINNWSWSFGNGQSSTLQNPSVNYLNPGPFDITLIVATNKGCTDTVIIPVNISMPFIASAIGSQNICPGSSALLSASGGVSYLWSSGQTLSSINVSPASASTYTVTVTDNKGCTDTTQAAVILFPLPVVTAIPNQSICIGQPATLSVIGASTYSWLPGGATGQSINVTPVTTTSYTITGTDANGCYDTAMVNVTVHALPLVSLSNPVICPSSVVTLNALNPGAVYQWSTGATSQSISASLVGTYSVTVTNSFGCSSTAQSIVSASALSPNVQSLSICQGAAVTFSAANPGNTYYWSTGVSTQTISVFSSGTYTVTVSDAVGCTISFGCYLVVNALPTVNFNSNNLCSNDSIVFTNTSSVASGTLTNYAWKFGDGSVSQQQNPHHKYVSAGVYNVCLVVTSNNGCIDSICKTITVNAPPNANFTVNNGCQGNALNLNNTSTPLGLSVYNWSFGNGTTSNSQSPALSYGIAGNYAIKLIVIDANGCSDTLQNTVTVFPLPQVTAAGSQPICSGQSATLTVSGASSYLWSPGGISGQSINVSPTTTTNYLVVGTDANGCADTSMVNIAVNALPTVILTSPVICPLSTVTLNAGNPGAAYQWSTGATTQSVTTSIAGSYSVTITNSAGCTASGQTTLAASTLAPNIQAFSICQGTSAIFNAANSGSIYLWSTGASTQNISVSNYGTYTVTVSDASGCSLSFGSVLNVNPLPMVNFNSGTACLNDSVDFINTSSVASGSLTNYNWNFGDGSISQQQNPHHKYASAGVYNVCLIVTTDNGCMDSICESITIQTPPNANFTVNNECQGNSLNLTNNSTSITLASYSWSFGNGATSSSALPSLSYNVSGNYLINLLMIDSNGCSDTTENMVSIYPLPQVTTSANQSICSGQSATLSTGGALSYVWLPGGVGSSINVSPAVSTNYLVTGTDVNGCMDTAMVNIVVNALPQVSLTNAVICPSSSVTLNAGNPGSGYQWSPGATSQSITTTIAGSYVVTVTNNFGCTAVGQSNVSASTLAPNTQFFSICQGAVASFDAANVGSTYQWSNGASTQTISSSGSGTYTVTVNDTSGCSLSFVSALVVNPVPNVNFTANSICFNDTTILTDNSTIATGTLFSYHWDFGDGSTSADHNPKHLYATAGTFITTLIVNSDSACTAQKTVPVLVHPKPLVDFAPNGSCAGNAMPLTNNSSISIGSITTFQWNFGDGSAMGSTPNPLHNYPLAGNYIVTLIGVSNFGCSDTVSKPVVVYPNPVTNFKYDKANGCGPLTIHFTDLSSIAIGNIVAWQWSFGDGNTSSDQHPTHTYTDAGTFSVTLITTSGEGCTNSYTKMNAITVYPDPVAEFTANPWEANILQQVSFENQSVNAVSYDWTFGDGAYSKLQDPVHQFDNPGTYMVTLTSMNQYGCTAEARHEMHIIPTWTVYIPNAFTPDNDGHNDIFTIQGIGIMKYNLKIFNRWGDLIFDADNRGWDGVLNGNTCKQDVYIYKVAFDVNIGGSFERDGQVSLLK